MDTYPLNYTRMITLRPELQYVYKFIIDKCKGTIYDNVDLKVQIIYVIGINNYKFNRHNKEKFIQINLLDKINKGHIVEFCKHILSNPINLNFFIRNSKKLTDFIDEYFKTVDGSDQLTIQTKIYWIGNGIINWDDKRIRCKYCNKSFKELKTHGNLPRNYAVGYPQHCCHSCKGKDPIYQKHLEESIMKKYHCKNSQQSTEIRKKIIENNNKKYGVDYPAQKKEIFQKTLDTKFKKYGNYAGDIEKYKNHFNKEVIDKIKSTNNKRYGVDYPLQSKDIHRKTLLNGPKSKEEDICYNILCEKFGKDNIERQYNKDDRYPFLCDFYIKDLDIFIEYLGYWTHGNHPFDSKNKDDKARLDEMMSKNKRYKNAAIIWALKDKYKRITADINEINFHEFWKVNDLRLWVENYEYKKNK